MTQTAEDEQTTLERWCNGGEDLGRRWLTGGTWRPGTEGRRFRPRRQHQHLTQRHHERRVPRGRSLRGRHHRIGGNPHPSGRLELGLILTGDVLFTVASGGTVAMAGGGALAAANTATSRSPLQLTGHPASSSPRALP